MKDDILRNFRKVVTPQFISEVAHQVKFNQKSTAQITGIDFARMLLMQIGSGREMNYSNLNATLSKINTKINISNQALSEYFYKQSSVNLVRHIYEKVFLFQKQELLKKYDKNIDQEMTSLFGRVLIEDSTVCILNEQLKDKFKGLGGSSSKSSLKIDIIHELKTSAILKLTIAQGSAPDVSLVSSILEELLSNDLVLRDLGYFKLDGLKNISDKNAYFISRFRSDIEVYLGAENVNPIDLGKYLKEEYKNFPGQLVDITVYLGRGKWGVRLIAYKVPPEIANERRRKVRKSNQQKGKGTPSESRLNLCDYVVLITNIPSEMVRAEVIGTIYRIRWSIELTFKTWKSHLNLQLNLKGHKITRIECFVYATLIICLLTTLVHGWLKKIDPAGKEISLDKLVKWLMNRQGYVRLFWGIIMKLESEIHGNMRNIRTQKRKRKTTLERVVSMEAYSEKYAINF